jgi:hypothetical protein
MRGHQITAFVCSSFMSQKFVFIIAKANQQDLTTSSDLMKSGKVTLVIGRCYKEA